jgi:hypothetical protein
MKGNIVQLRSLFAVLIVTIGAWVCPFGAAQASTVLYDGVGFIEGQQSFTQAFDITGTGTLTVSLSQVPWLDTIAGLNCFLSTANGLVGTTMSSGSESMSVGPGMIYVHWFGDADGTYGLGVYSMKIAFYNTPAVALPGSLILLLSGFGVLLGWQRRQILPPMLKADEALTI